MNDEPEFSILNIYFGMVIPVFILHLLLVMLCQIFDSLYFISTIIMVIILTKALTIFDKELRIFAKVV